MKKELYQFEESKNFYENRFQTGYMDEWPLEKKERVYQLIKNLNLPKSGFALDFGCGNGVFTDVLFKALPDWKIYGSDISEIAINHAKNRYPYCFFFTSGSDSLIEVKFDFIFSHHVLEHVYDIEKSIDEMSRLLKERSCMMHILPCGNSGSFEFKICKLRIDGINKNLQNRFFFEDEGHVRRLNSSELSSLMVKHRFELNKEFYSNQFYGAIKWIIDEPLDFINDFANPRKAKGMKSFFKLYLVNIILRILNNVQQIYKNKFYSRVKLKKAKHYILYLYHFILFYLSSPIYKLISNLADNEWRKKKQNRNGSEMYLYYVRN